MQASKNKSPLESKGSSYENQGSTTHPSKLGKVLNLLGIRRQNEPLESTTSLIESSHTKAFTPDTIIHPKQPNGGRDLATYESYLSINRQDLEGERILDLGSGPQAKFAKELEDAGINAQVISFSPDYSDENHALSAKRSYDRHLVAGVGEAMPFKDASFDKVFALFSHVHARDHYNFIKEINRILAPGGEAKLSPDAGFDTLYQYVTNNESLMQELDLTGTSVQLQPIPRELFEMRAIDTITGHRAVVGGNILIITKATSDPTSSQ